MWCTTPVSCVTPGPGTDLYPASFQFHRGAYWKSKMPRSTAPGCDMVIPTLGRWKSVLTLGSSDPRSSHPLVRGFSWFFCKISEVQEPNRAALMCAGGETITCEQLLACAIQCGQLGWFQRSFYDILCSNYLGWIEPTDFFSLS